MQEFLGWTAAALLFTAGLAYVARVLIPWRPTPDVRWSAVDALLGFLSYFVIGGTILGLLQATLRHPADSAADLSMFWKVMGQGATHVLVFALVYGIVRSRGEDAPLRALGFRPGGNLRSLSLGLLAIFASYPLIAVAAEIQSTVWVALHGEPPAPQPILQEILALPSGAERVLVLAVVAFFVPFAEEYLFRGFLQPVFVRFFGASLGIVGTSLLFALVHEPEVWFGIFAFSCLLGWLYHRTGRLASCWALHALNNAIAVYWPSLSETFSP